MKERLLYQFLIVITFPLWISAFVIGAIIGTVSVAVLAGITFVERKMP